jgi:hypothetical protein
MIASEQLSRLKSRRNRVCELGHLDLRGVRTSLDIDCYSNRFRTFLFARGCGLEAVHLGGGGGPRAGGHPRVQLDGRL